MAVYDVGGQEFEVPDNVQGQQLNDILTQLSQQVISAPAQPVEVESESSALGAVGAGFRRGVEKLTGGLGQRAFEASLASTDSKLAELTEQINTGQIPANEENLAKFDTLSIRSGELKHRLGIAEERELSRREEFAEVSKEFPKSAFVGDVGGQIVASTLGALTAVGPAAVAVPATLLGRSALGAGIGAAEGFVQPTVDKEKVSEKVAVGATFGGIAPTAIEKVLSPIAKRVAAPVIGFFKSIAQKTGISKFKAGEFKSSFDKRRAAAVGDIGEAFDDVSKAVEKSPGLTPEQVAREAAFKEAGITPAARSRITRDPDDFQREIQLLRQRDSEAANKLRQNFFQESKELQEEVRVISESLGVPESAGQSIKQSLDGIQSSLSASKRVAYADLARTIEKADPALIDSIPIGSTQIRDSMEDAQRRFLKDSEANKVDQLMAEFGLIGEAGPKVGRFTPVDVGEASPIKVRGDVQELNISTLEDFRIRINDIFDLSSPKEAAAHRNIISTIDRETDTLIDGLKEAKISTEIIDKARKARGLARREKAVFNNKDLVERLTSTKKGSSTPLVEASRAMAAIKSAPKEQVLGLIKTLESSESGQKAIGNMGSSIIIDLLNSATKAASRQLTGPQGQNLIDFSGTSFTKAINSFGSTPEASRGLIKRIIGKDAFKKLQQMEKIGEIRITPESAVQKGSAPDLINQLIRSASILSKFPIPFGGRIREGAESIAQRREVAKATNIKPDELSEEMKDFIIFNASRLAPLFGLTEEQ